MQLGLFLADGTQKSGVAEIHWIPTESLVPHPDNPRLVYREDIIETIAQSITEEGFKPEYALLVRPLGEDCYQIISGHTRYKAALQAQCQTIPCWVKDLDDEAAFMELVLANNQGELSPLEYGIHVLKYVENSEGGRGKKGGLSEYARQIGRDKAVISRNKQAATILSSLNSCDIATLLDKANHLAAIHKAPEKYWQQLTELLIAKEWSVKQTEAIVEAVKSVNIPEILHGFLDPEYWVKRIITDAISDKPQGHDQNVNRWVEGAMRYLEGDEALPTQVGSWEFKDDNPVFVEVNLQEQFLARLPEMCNGDKVPSVSRITALAQKLRDELKKANTRYDEWKAARESAESAQRLREERLARQNALEVKFSPNGLNMDILNVTLADLGNELFDAIITDPPYLLSNGGSTVRSGKEVSVDKNFDDSEGSAPSPMEWLEQCVEWLKPGGYLVATCTDHLLFDLQRASMRWGLVHLQNLIWHKENAPPLLTADRFTQDYEYVFVAYKPDGSRFFGYETIQIDGKQRGAVINIPQCGGKERLNWHDTQKPLELMELLINAYVPTDGRVLDPFAGSGTTAVAAKRLNRVSYWIEKKPDFFEKAQSRIESEPFDFSNLEF